jgi:hypothetical protein
LSGAIRQKPGGLLSGHAGRRVAYQFFVSLCVGFCRLFPQYSANSSKMPTTSGTHPSSPSDLPYTSDSGYWFYMIRIAFLTIPVIAWWYYSQSRLDQEWVFIALAISVAVSLTRSSYVLILDESNLSVVNRSFYGARFSKNTSFIRSEIEEINLSKWELYPYPNFYTSGRRRYIAYLDIITRDAVTQEVARSRFSLITYIRKVQDEIMTAGSFPPLILAVSEVRQLLNLPE